MLSPSTIDERPLLAAAAAAAILVLGMASSAGADVRSDNPKTAGPFPGKASRYDVSPPLWLMARPVPTPEPGVFVELLHSTRNLPDRPGVSGVPDPLRQTLQRPDPEAASTPTPSSSFEGLGNLNGVAPPDTVGDVGRDFYVQWVNLSFAIYDKSTGLIATDGGPFTGDVLWTDFGGPCETNNDGDPIVIYDHLAERWLLSQFSIDEGVQCLALSTTSDPRGTWDRWAFVVSPGERNDYPKIGLMPDAYYMTTRDFPFDSGNFTGFVAFDRAAMLAGNPAAGFIKYGLPCVDFDCPDGVQPPHLEGPPPPAGTPGFFTKAWDDDWLGPLPGGTGLDGYRIWKFEPDFVSPGSSTFVELPLVPSGADFDSTVSQVFQPEVGAPCIIFQGQLFNCEDLDDLSGFQMYRAPYRHFETHDAIVLIATVDASGANDAGVRWAELRNSDPAGSGSWTVYQDGTYAPADGDNRWMGSIAMDADGGIAIGYSVASDANTTYPSIRYVTREAGDTLGTMPGGEQELKTGSGSQTGTSRWGDYSSMSVDPTDDCTFWYTQEYIQTTGSFNWKTWIGAFKNPACSAEMIDVSPAEQAFGPVEVGGSSPPETAVVTNNGADPVEITELTLLDPTDFALDTNPASDPCGAPSFVLAAGDSCNVAVTFTPQSQAIHTTALEVETAAAGVYPTGSDESELSGTGYVPCPHSSTETLTGSGSGTVTVDACETVTIGPYDFTGGTLTVTAGDQIVILDGTGLAGTTELGLDPFLSLP